MTWSSYPGIYSGIGVTYPFTGDNDWIVLQNSSSGSGEPNVIFWIISVLFSLNFGEESYPISSKIFEARTAPLTASQTTDGAINKPWKINRCWLNIAPPSEPIPGAVSLTAERSTRSSFPAIYPPASTIPPPAFFINEPAIKSAPTSVGSLVSTNSP